MTTNLEKMIIFLEGCGYGSHDDPDWARDPNYRRDVTETTAYWHYRQVWMVRVENDEVWAELDTDVGEGASPSFEYLKFVTSVIGFATVLAMPVHCDALRAYLTQKRSHFSRP